MFRQIAIIIAFLFYCETRLWSNIALATVNYDSETQKKQLISIDHYGNKAHEVRQSLFEKKVLLKNALTKSSHNKYGEIKGIALSDGGYVVSTCDDILKLNKDFHIVWKVKTGALSSPLSCYINIAEQSNVIVFATGSRTVRALDSKTGKFIWTRELSGRLRGKFSLDKDRKVIYTSVTNGKMYSINAINGSIVWTAEAGITSKDSGLIGNIPRADTCYFKDTIAFAQSPDRIFFTNSEGRLVSDESLDIGEFTHVANAVLCKKESLWILNKDKILVLDPVNGREKFSIKIEERYEAIAQSDNVTLIAESEGLSAYNENGKKIWHVKESRDFLMLPADNSVFVIDGKGNMKLLDVKDGSVIGMDKIFLKKIYMKNIFLAGSAVFVPDIKRGSLSIFPLRKISNKV